MCNLNILIRNKEYMKNNNVAVAGFMMAVTSNSFTSNDDGDGLYCDYKDHLVKSLVKINIFDSLKFIEKSNLILSHQRLSTSGHTIEYTHPFESENFILVHNGVINSFLGDKGSDTSGFFDKLNAEFNKIDGLREERLVTAIKNLLDGVHGSYSIAIYDKLTKDTYYFKNSSTNIEFHQNEDCLFITTNYQNHKFLNLLDGEFKIKKIKDFKIYKIFVNEKVNVIKVAKIERPVYQQVSVYNFSGYKNYGIGFAGGYDYGIKEDKPKKPETVVSATAMPCENCRALTHLNNIDTNTRICQDCMEEYGYDYPDYV